MSKKSQKKKKTKKICIQKQIKEHFYNMKYENKIFYIVAGTIVFFSIYIWFTMPSQFQDFYTKFVAGFLGVLIGFNLDRIVESSGNRHDKKILLHTLRNELIEINKMLVSPSPITGDASMLYPDIWDSAISSGQLKLLDLEQITKLSKIYRLIKSIEFEMKTFITPFAEIKSKQLQEMINGILKEDWWPKN